VQLILQALGGPFMSSVLNLLLRERYGWGYSVYSFYHGYAEKGVWGIYAGLMPEVGERALGLIQRKLAEWQAHPISVAQLRALKNQFWGRQAILWERLSYRLQVQGRWLLDKGHPLEESNIREQLFSMSGEDLWAAARRYFSPQWVAILQPLHTDRSA
jgi:predicted Zn-dependent peptidase